MATGDLKSVRAVGLANGQNPIPIIVRPGFGKSKRVLVLSFIQERPKRNNPVVGR